MLKLRQSNKQPQSAEMSKLRAHAQVAKKVPHVVWVQRRIDSNFLLGTTLNSQCSVSTGQPEDVLEHCGADLHAQLCLDIGFGLLRGADLGFTLSQLEHARRSSIGASRRETSICSCPVGFRV